MIKIYKFGVIYNYNANLNIYRRIIIILKILSIFRQMEIKLLVNN